MRMRATMLLVLVSVAAGCGPDQPVSCSERLVGTGPWHTIECNGATCADGLTAYEARWRPATDENNKLLIVFEGGGACWDYQTCLYKEKPEISDGRGIFDDTNTLNPFQDYDLVVIPYCTWDLHWGSLTVEYLRPTATPGALAMNEPTPTSGPDSLTVHHQGFRNADAVLEWVYEKFKEPTSIVIVGISAGSLGAILHTPYIMDRYRNSTAQILHIGDSGVLFPQEADLKKQYEALDHFTGAPLKVSHTTYVTGTNGIDLAAFYAAVANSYPNHRFALFNFVRDCVQIGVYERYYEPTRGLKKIMKDPESRGLIKNAVGSIHDLVDSKAGNFYSYTETSADCVASSTSTAGYACKIDGGPIYNNRCHCILGSDRFYELEVAQGMNGVSLLQWVSVLVGNGQGARPPAEVKGRGKLVP